ncbi:MAG: hypothetical protein GF419_05500 [Ignavibacteriales bacterium]|nr:hypothetical protein [Ignavibacteriales bacterium]
MTEHATDYRELERDRAGRAARIISNVFIPPVNVFAAAVVFALHYEEGATKTALVIVVAFLFVVAVPIAYFLRLLKTKRVSDPDARDRSERTAPYLVGVALFLVAAGLLALLGADTRAQALMIAYALSTSAVLGVNAFWKISMHAVGVGAPLAAFYYAFGAWALTGVVVFAVVAWARRRLQCHTPAQLLSGGATGFAVVLAVLEFLTPRLAYAQ